MYACHSLHSNLAFNQLACENISTVYQLVQTGVANNDLMCRYSNGTSVFISELNTDINVGVSATSTALFTSTLPSTSLQITTSKTVSSSISADIPLPTELISNSTSRNIPLPTSFVATPTPIPVALYCLAETTLTSRGYFDWPITPAGSHVIITCPNGPEDEQAGRSCVASGSWGEVNVSECGEASQTVQILAYLSNVSKMQCIFILLD